MPVRRVVAYALRLDLTRILSFVVEQVFFHEGGELVLVFDRETAVHVVCCLAVGKILLGTEGLEDFDGGHGVCVAGAFTEPYPAGIVENQERARGDHAGQVMVVCGQVVDSIAVITERGAEPGGFLTGVAERLGFAVLGGATPVGSSAGAGFLRNDERDSCIEGTCDKSCLSETGTAGDGEMMHIDARFGRFFEGVDEAADAPGPGNQRTCAVVAAIHIIEFARSTRLFGSDVVLVERNGGDIQSRVVEASAAEPDNGGLRGVLGACTGNLDAEAEGFPLVCNGDLERTAGVASFHFFRIAWLFTELHLFKECSDFFAAAFPPVLGGDSGSVEHGERIGELGVCSNVRDVGDGTFVAEVFLEGVTRVNDGSFAGAGLCQARLRETAGVVFVARTGFCSECIG